MNEDVRDGGVEIPNLGENRAVAHLRELSPDIDIGSSFELTYERGACGEPIPAEASWIRVVDGERSVEGKLFLPPADKANGELL